MRDGDFSLEKLLERTNDFSDIYGNLVMRSLGRNIAGPVLERGIGTVRASEGTRDRLRHLVDEVSKKYDHVLFAEGYELIIAEMRTVLLWRSNHEDEHLLQRDASLDNYQGDQGGRRFQSPHSHFHSVGNRISLECRMDVWESLRVCSVLLQPIIPTCRFPPFLSCVDSSRVLSIVFHEDLEFLPLSELASHPLEGKRMQCSSERVFQKLSKADQAKFLRL